METRTRNERNKVMPYDKDIHIRIRNEYMDKLRNQARQHHFTISRMVRFIVENYLDNHEN